jgi:hypothetical protein
LIQNGCRSLTPIRQPPLFLGYFRAGREVVIRVARLAHILFEFAQLLAV